MAEASWLLSEDKGTRAMNEKDYLWLSDITYCYKVQHRMLYVFAWGVRLVLLKHYKVGSN